MTTSPAHTYVDGGIKKGLSPEVIKKIVERTEASLKHGVPAIYSLNHIAHYTGVEYSYLKLICDRKIFPYTPHSIPKRSGGLRFLHAPHQKIKIVQQWISRYILSSATPHWRCYSFHPKASIVDCAQQHCGAKWLIKIDIERFFESVREESVYQTFRSMGYHALLSFELTRLCTMPPQHLLSKQARNSVAFRLNEHRGPYSKYKRFGRLPQGAPTSPMLSNLAFYNLDEEFQSISRSNGLVYTRYADDICFSSSSSSFTRHDALHITKQVFQRLRENGYSPNKTKLKIIPPGSRKIVLGLAVEDAQPRLTKAFKSRIESHLWGLGKFGPSSHAESRNFRSIGAMIDHVNGLISYAGQVEYEYAIEKRARLKRIIYDHGIPYI